MGKFNAFDIEMYIKAGLQAKKIQSANIFTANVEYITANIFRTTGIRIAEAAIAELFDKYITPEEIAARIILMLDK